MKSSIEHTFLKGGTYYFRHRIPTDLLGRPPFRPGQKEIKFSLKTKSKDEALRRMAKAYEEYDRQVALAAGRSGSDAASAMHGSKSWSPPAAASVPSRKDLERAVHRFHTAYLASHPNTQDAKLNREYGRYGQRVLAGKLEEDWLQIVRELEDDNVERPLRSYDAATSILVENNWDMDLDGEDFDYFLDRIRYAELGAIRGILERSKNKAYVPYDEMRRIEIEQQTSRFTITDAVNAYVRQMPQAREMHEKMHAAVAMWCALMPTETVSAIDTRHVREFIDALRQMPANAKQRFLNVSARETIAQNKLREDPYPLISAATIKANYISILNAALNLAVENQLAPGNPFEGQRVSGSSKKVLTRRPFTISELRKIFFHPIFQGYASRTRRYEPGSELVKDHHYWPPLIALYSGMRAQEVGALLVSDVGWVHIEGVSKPYFEVPGTKTENAIRQLPVHPALVELGFLDYVAERKASGDQRLFPGWLAPKGKKLSEARCIRNFNEKVVASVIPGRDRPSFHCFRHTLLSELESTEISMLFLTKIMGHSGKETTAGKHYYVPTIDRYYDRFCDAVEYRGLNLVELLGRSPTSSLKP